MIAQPALPTALNRLIFSNRFTQQLPADPSTMIQPRQVTGACFSRVRPKVVAKPQLVAYSREVAELLDLTPESITSAAFSQIFTGNQQLPGMDPHAMCYGGHQFGNWAGQLGDGRAINLGEVVNGRGHHWTLQLKGAGPTPYSRGADGLAVLRSSVREFLCSEAMHHLGVPTTRALSLLVTGDQVIRDMFYDGNPKAEPGAIVCRVAPSFVRFGNFEILAARGDTALLRQLADYTIRTEFPHLGEPSPVVYTEWFAEICRRTALMVVDWMRVGFVHGVMNTDNMSILGLTIDYGPYGWLENYDPNWTPNTTDAGGRRYRYGHQPRIAHWNLVQLANAIYPLIGEVPPLEAALKGYADTYQTTYHAMMAAKLGFAAFDPTTDVELFNELLTLLQLVETDMTIFYRKLATLPLATLADADLADPTTQAQLLTLLSDAYYDLSALNAEYLNSLYSWLYHYRARLQRDGDSDQSRAARMNAVNPKYVLRNYLAQLAIDQAETGDYALVNELLDLLRHPYAEQPERESFAAKRPDWARQRAGCSMLSCSS